MDNRASFIELFIEKDCPIYYDDIVSSGADWIYGYWESLGYKVEKWPGDKEGKYFYCYKSRLISKYVKTDDALEYIVVPGFKNPRWIILNKKKVFSQHGLIIKPTSLKSRIVWAGAKILNKLNLFTIVFPDRFIVKGSEMAATVFDGNGCSPNILYTGAAGKYQKFTIQYVDEYNKPSYYLKLANSKGGIDRIINECGALEKLGELELEYMETPKLVEKVGNDKFFGFVQSNILTDETLTAFLTEKDLLAISELYNKFGIQEVSLYEYLNGIRLYKYEDELSVVVDYLDSMKEKKIFLASSHGDYIPWNRFVSANNVKVIDWETFKYRPLFYDICYFLMHKAILIEKVPAISASYENISYSYDLLSRLNKSIYLESIDVKFYMLINLIELYLHYRSNNHEADQFFLRKIHDGIIAWYKQQLV